jgi:hypothetical protein
MRQLNSSVFDLALLVDHQAGVEEAGVGNAVLLHAADGGQDDLAHGAGVHVGRDHRRGRIGAHAAVLGPGRHRAGRLWSWLVASAVTFCRRTAR